jgi:tetratricopeptide (TPR) repeat protein
VRQGAAAYRTGDYHAAADRFRAAARLEPGLATAHLNLGMAALALFSAAPKGGERDAVAREAIAALRRYAKLRPADPRTAGLLLTLWMDSGRYDDALGYFRARLQSNPRDAETVKLLGVVSSKAGRFDDALRWYQRRTELGPHDAEAHYAIGTLCWERLHDHPDVAGPERVRVADTGIAALLRATELKPDYAEAWTYANLLYRERALGQATDELRQQDIESANRYYRKALDIVRSRH